MTNCVDVDVKGYLLGEADAREKERVSAHLAGCERCREEMERLRVTQMALENLREEEPPRRIAFVSDKIFEPRWWQRWFAPGPVAAFASAAVIAIAIFAHGEMVKPLAARPAVNQAQMERQVLASFDGRLQTAISKAVTDVRAEDKQESAALLEAAEKRFAEERRADLAAFEINYENLYKRTALDRKLAYSAVQAGITQ